MKVLFDHNLPHKLRTSLMASKELEITTTSFLGWGELRNGVLLAAAEGADFDVFVTGDRTLIYEQNLSGRKLAIITLSTNNWPILRDFIPDVSRAITHALPGSVVEVYCGRFVRRKS